MSHSNRAKSRSVNSALCTVCIIPEQCKYFAAMLHSWHQPLLLSRAHTLFYLSALFHFCMQRRCAWMNMASSCLWSPAAPRVALTNENHIDGTADPTTGRVLCILNATRLGCLVFAETADDLPCSFCPLLNQGRIDLIASLAKGPARSPPLPHCSMSRVQSRGKVNRVNSISLT